MNAKPYHICIAPRAKRQILALAVKYQKLVIKFMESLAINPRPPCAKRIEGMTGLYSQPIDQHRLLYKVEEHEVLVLLIK